VTWVEPVAAALGLVNIILIVRRSVWNYMFGLLMVSLYFFVFLEARLYSDALLQIFFFVVQIYGWWHWARVEAEAGEVTVERLSTRQRLVWSAMTILAVLGWGSLMRTYTDASYPIWDASVAALSVVAQLLMSRRYVENWILWILVDLLSIGLYAAKELWLTTGLYTIFLLLAVYGFVQWLRAPRGSPTPPIAGAQAG
jgi:nicotinamide mononucleotide transporter